MAADPITGIAAVVDDSIKIALQKDAQENTPAQVAAKLAKEFETFKAEVRKAIENDDMETLRILCS